MKRGGSALSKAKGARLTGQTKTSGAARRPEGIPLHNLLLNNSSLQSVLQDRGEPPLTSVINQALV